jgi:hypothetical protein
MTEITERRPNRAPWLALLLALAAMLSNGAFFLGLPGQQVIPWLGVALTIAALVYAVLGLLRAFRQPQVYGGKVSSSILGVVALLICAVSVFTSVHSRDLPAAGGAPQVGQKAPDFTLADTSGNKVSLGQLLGKGHASALTGSGNAGGSPAGAASNASAAAPKAVLLVFYRGYW